MSNKECSNLLILDVKPLTNWSLISDEYFQQTDLELKSAGPTHGKKDEDEDNFSLNLMEVHTAADCYRLDLTAFKMVLLVEMKVSEAHKLHFHSLEKLFQVENIFW